MHLKHKTANVVHLTMFYDLVSSQEVFLILLNKNSVRLLVNLEIFPYFKKSGVIVLLHW